MQRKVVLSSEVKMYYYNREQTQSVSFIDFFLIRDSNTHYNPKVHISNSPHPREVQ